MFFKNSTNQPHNESFGFLRRPFHHPWNVEIGLEQGFSDSVYRDLGQLIPYPGEGLFCVLLDF